MPATVPEHDSYSRREPVDYTSPASAHPAARFSDLGEALRRVNRPLYLHLGKDAAADNVLVDEQDGFREHDEKALFVPRCHPCNLGDPAFCLDHGLRFPYYAGAMANGIASEEIVEALGASACSASSARRASRPSASSRPSCASPRAWPDYPSASTSSTAPARPALAGAVADLYIKHGLRLVEASAYIGLTLPLVRFRTHGIHRDASGRIVAPNKVIAKVSRAEVAQRFFAPPPERMLKKLVEARRPHPDQAELAAEIPMAQDVTMPRPTPAATPTTVPRSRLLPVDARPAR
jgi:trans-AT polyketide synthase, acyltransferase and oxidoreductase domains